MNRKYSYKGGFFVKRKQGFGKPTQIPQKVQIQKAVRGRMVPFHRKQGGRNS